MAVSIQRMEARGVKEEEWSSMSSHSSSSQVRNVTDGGGGEGEASQEEKQPSWSERAREIMSKTKALVRRMLDQRFDEEKEGEVDNDVIDDVGRLLGGIAVVLTFLFGNTNIYFTLF